MSLIALIDVGGHIVDQPKFDIQAPKEFVKAVQAYAPLAILRFYPNWVTREQSKLLFVYQGITFSFSGYSCKLNFADFQTAAELLAELDKG